MAGKNPYITAAEHMLPKQKYTITFQLEESKESKLVEVDPESIPYGRTGEPGSILDIALGAGIDLEHSCGGVCACSTCHVIVKQGLSSCNPSTDDEDDMLDEAPGVTTESRLGCQCVPNGTQNLVVVIPQWNRNAVKEGH
jgi:2Fe-2S ferredoxin